jgi:protein ImuB
VDRMACVDLPALPLQLLVLRNPEWRGLAVAVTAEDSPQAELLWVNEVARAAGILPGLRYAAALSLDRNLRGGTVGARTIGAATDRLQRHLLRYSPQVEPARHEPGVFWLNADGLERLYGSPLAWAQRLRRSLKRVGLEAGIVVGFSRFGSYCLARTRGGVSLLPSRAAEAAASNHVPLARLAVEPRLREDLERLGVDTVGQLLALPAAGLAGRFGSAAAALYELARGERFAPLQPIAPPEPDRACWAFDEPETDAWRLMFLIKRLLDPLLGRLADRRQAVARLRLDFVQADRSRCRETLQPAAPTLDVVLLMELVRLRLENLALAAGVGQVVLEVAGIDAPPEALRLFQERPRRDLNAALRAIARLRAEFGDQAVVRAELGAGHLPRASFRWAVVQELAPPRPAAPPRRPLIRRLLVRPWPLAGGSRAGAGPAGPGKPEPLSARSRLHGPYWVSGGWWRREVRRAYHFVEDGSGALWWVYYDQRRGRWYLEGWVE